MKEFVSTERIMNELNSEWFASGVEKAIQLTRTTGRETGFHILKSFGGRWFAYPDEIYLGSEKKIGPALIEEIQQSAVERYKKENAGAPTNKEFYEESEEFYSYCKERNIHTTEKMSMWRQLLDKRKSGVRFRDLINTTNSRYYNFFDFHTHPTQSSLCPSLEDLIVLNERRRRNKELVGVALSPIALTPAVGADENIVRVMIYKEKTSAPLDKKDIRKCYEDVCSLHRVRYAKSKEEMLLEAIFNRSREREIESRLPYSFITVNYDLEKKAFDFGKSFEIEMRY